MTNATHVEPLRYAQRALSVHLRAVRVLDGLCIVDKVVSTRGAGDCFVAACAWKLVGSRGRREAFGVTAEEAEEDEAAAVRAAVKAGVVAGALACKGEEAVPLGLKPWVQYERWYDK